jgi:hypothetical protein
MWRLPSATLILLGIVACLPQAEPAGRQGPPFRLTATIRELMDSEIDPAPAAELC